jgi:hypothetical protein
MVGPLKKTVRFPERGRRHFWQDKQCDNFDRMQKKILSSIERPRPLFNLF